MKRILLLSMILYGWTIQAQNDGTSCPIVEFTTQEFCESEGTGNNFYRPAIKHLEATSNGDGVAWYDTATSNDALPLDELLVDGEDYYAGNVSNTCTERVMVLVELSDAPNAGATTQVTFCSTGAPVDLLDVYRPSILGPPDAGGIITPALASGTTEFDPSIDPAGTYRYTVSSTSDCPDDYSIIYISVTPAPNAGENGIANFSTSTEPHDLFTFLGGDPDEGGVWTPELNSGSGIYDPAIDNPGVYTYTITGGVGCEDASATVTVVRSDDPEPQNCPVVEFTTQEYCESEGTGNNYYRPAIKHLKATANGDDIAWYDTATSTEALSFNEFLVDGEDYYAGNVSNTCSERVMVTVVLDDSPNAGRTTSITVNSTDAPFDLLDIYEPSILGPPDAGGTVTPALASGTTVFNPAVDAGGQYKYIVQSNNDQCPDDSSYIYITVNEAVAESSFQAKADVSVYPNPSNGIINLSTIRNNSIYTVRIFDIQGNLVKNLKVDSGSIENLDISSLRPAIYIAEINTAKGKVVKRIVKR